MPIFRVKSVKIYTGQKKFTRIYSWRSWQISGMTVSYAGLFIGWANPLKLVATVRNFEATTLFCQVFQFSTHRKGRLVQLGEKVNSGNDNLTFPHCSYYWDVSQHMEKEKAQNGFEKAILCLNSFFPIKIKEKESVRLRNPRRRITFPLNLIYPPSQSMQFHPSQTS